MTDSNRIADDLAELGAATVSDALDAHGLHGAVVGLSPQTATARLSGPAFTVRYVPCAASPGSVGDYLDACVPGQVVVLDNAGRLDCTVWGDILTSLASQRRIAGTVIDGVCRDIGRASELGYPIHSRGRHTRTGKGRVEATALGEPVSLGNVRVTQGDLVVGDEDGVVIIPVEHATAVLDTARAIHLAEEKLRADLAAGASLADARERHGYHTIRGRSG